MFFAYPVAFSLIALLTSFLPSTPANALPTAVHPQTQSHTSHKDIDSTSTKVQTSYLSRRTVYNPNIIRPAQGDDWKVGSWVKVIWFVARSLFTSVFPNFVSNLVCLYICWCRDTKGIPDGSNLEGKVLLGHVEEGSENEHLDIGMYIDSHSQLRFERRFSLLLELTGSHFPAQNIHWLHPSQSQPVRSK